MESAREEIFVTKISSLECQMERRLVERHGPRHARVDLVPNYPGEDNRAERVVNENSTLLDAVVSMTCADIHRAEA